MNKLPLILAILLLCSQVYGQEDICQSGIDSAKVDISKGEYKIYIFGHPNSYTFGRILEEEYGIAAIYWGSIVEEKWRCYSNYMRERIKERYGEDFFESVVKRSQLQDSLGKGDRNASFPGGEVELMKFVYCNLDLERANYTDDDKGKVALQFTIDTLGNVTDIVVGRSWNQDYSLEAIRVVSMMPNWITATFNGKSIKQIWTLPIIFDKKFKEEHCP